MPTHLDNEPTLVAEAQRGNTGAFTTLVNQYDRNIHRLALNITGNQEDAEDVLQEAFLKAYRKLDSFRGNSRFYTWLVRIAVNEALMKLRKRRGGAARRGELVHRRDGRAAGTQGGGGEVALASRATEIAGSVE